MTWQFFSVLPIWVLSLAGAIVFAVLLPRDEYFTWVGITLAAAVILTFMVQLGIRRKEGFVTRVMASVGVSVIILAGATGIVALLG